MAIPFLAFWVLIFLGREDLGLKKTFYFVATWIILLSGFIFLKIPPYFFVAVQAFLDCILILVVFGRNINIR